MANTKHYSLIKPTVGGSENEWGGNLNQDLDDIDGLLGGDQPVQGINIIAGENSEGNKTEIEGGAITGEIGGDYDPSGTDDPVSIHPDTWISGRVHTLVGLDPNDAEVNMRGPGVIDDCLIKARDLEIKGYIKEGQVDPSNVTSATFSPDSGTVHVINLQANQACVYNISLGSPGENLTLILNKGDQDTNATQITWEANGAANQIKWVGGGEPDLEIGINVIQFFSINLNNTGTVVIGAHAGTAS